MGQRISHKPLLPGGPIGVAKRMSKRGTTEGRSGRNQKDRKQAKHRVSPHRFKTYRILDKTAQNCSRHQTLCGINRECTDQEPDRDIRSESDEQSNRKRREDKEPPLSRPGVAGERKAKPNPETRREQRTPG